MIRSISIVIPVYNGSLLIERCLDSVFKQQGQFNLEVIVVDDGSTDHSIDIIKAYEKPVTLIQQDNLGPAAARNKGIKAAAGRYLTFLDADDYWKPNFLKETVSFLESHKAIAVSAGQIHKIIGKPDQIRPQLLESDQFSPNKGVVLDNFYEFWSQHNHVCTGSVLMDTEIVKQTGGQRPELRITEDLEFWAYLATYGAWGFIPKVLFVSDGGKVTQEQGWLEKNRKRWASAPTVAEWESRIMERLPKTMTASFSIAKGRIAKNLAYAMMLSKRQEQARQTTLLYKNTYPKDKLSFLMALCAPYKPIWDMLCVLIMTKEKLK